MAQTRASVMGGNHHSSDLLSQVPGANPKSVLYNVVETLVNHPFGNGLYHLQNW